MKQADLNWQQFGHFVLILVNRHWLIGFENLVLTSVLGCGFLYLLAMTGRGIVQPVILLKIRRFILLFALLKGAYYLLMGDSITPSHRYPFTIGIQCPDIRDVLNLFHHDAMSIWSPSALTWEVTAVLLTYAVIWVLVRFSVVNNARREIERNVYHSSDLEEKLQEYVRNASTSIGQPQLGNTGVLVVQSLPTASPFVIGFWKPRIVVALDVLEMLIDKNWLDAVIRHELTHIRRFDHRTRWIQIILEDIASLTLVSRYIGKLAFSCEEQLCDCAAIKNASDAESLAFAIAKTHRMGSQKYGARNQLLSVSPGLAGSPSKRNNSRSELTCRLLHISDYVAYLSNPVVPSKPKFPLISGIGVVVIGLLIIAILYLKFCAIFSV